MTLEEERAMNNLVYENKVLKNQIKQLAQRIENIECSNLYKYQEEIAALLADKCDTINVTNSLSNWCERMNHECSNCPLRQKSDTMLWLHSRAKGAILKRELDKHIVWLDKSGG